MRNMTRDLPLRFFQYFDCFLAITFFLQLSDVKMALIDGTPQLLDVVFCSSDAIQDGTRTRTAANQQSIPQSGWANGDMLKL
jgi:hypothetical protein